MTGATVSKAGATPSQRWRFFRRVRGAVVIALLLGVAAAGARADDVIGEIQFYKVRQGGNLLDVARDNGLGYVELISANPGVDPWLPGEGRKILLPTAHILPDAGREGIVVNIAELRMYYFRGGGSPVVTFPIGVGREGFKTPLGQTRIVRKQASPTWYPTAGKRQEDPDLPAVVPPGPDNPLGEYALYLGWPLYLMHGTNFPDGVGRRVSRGCIRLYPENIEWLFQNTGVGTKVTVLTQPVKLGWRGGELYLEVAPTGTQVDEIDETGYAVSRAPLREQSDPDIILAKAGPHANRLDWDAVAWALQQRDGVPVQITKALRAGAPRPTDAGLTPR